MNTRTSASNCAVISKYNTFGDHTIVVISETSNRKLQARFFVGKTFNIYIIPSSDKQIDSWEAYENVVCSKECPHRKDQLGDCYVGSYSVWSVVRKYRESLAENKNPQTIYDKSNYAVRATAHGDMEVLNFEGRMFMYNLLVNASEARAYTSGWNTPHMQMFSDICMASVNDIESARQAQALGWKTYRVRHNTSTQKDLREVNCVVLGNGHISEQGRGCFGSCATPCNGKRHNVVSPNHEKLKAMQKRFDEKLVSTAP